MKHLLILVCAALLLTGCRNDDPKEKELPDRTVLVYMAAENNLDSYAVGDLEELREGSKFLTGNNNLIVFVDKAESNLPYIIKLKNGKTTDSIPCTTDGITSDPAFFEEVLRTVFNKYEAKSYGLVLWGHSDGWGIRSDSVEYTALGRRKAYGGDTGTNSKSGPGNTWMNIPSMAKVLKRMPHLDFIFADCCCFMCAEVAYELKDVTDYIIGSPAEIPAAGAPYLTVVPAMMQKTGFWKEIADCYYEQGSKDTGRKVPLSVVETSKLPALAAATRIALQIVADSLKRAEADYPDMSNLIYYYRSPYLYDMKEFLRRYLPESEFQSLLNTFNQTVVYQLLAKTWDTAWNIQFSDFTMTEDNYGGISMFVPMWNYQYTHNEYIKKMGWYYAAGYADVGW